MGSSSSKALAPSIEGAVVAEDRADFLPVFQGSHTVELPAGVTFTQARTVLFAGGAAAKAVVCLSDLADPESFAVIDGKLPWEGKQHQQDEVVEEQHEKEEKDQTVADDDIARYTFTEKVPVVGPLSTAVKLYVAQRALSSSAADVGAGGDADGDAATPSSVPKSATMLYESRTDKGVWVRKCRTVRQDGPSSPVVVAEAYQGVISPMWASMAGAKAAEAHRKHMDLYAGLFAAEPDANVPSANH